MSIKQPFVVDQILVVCKGCTSVRKFEINPPMRSTEELVIWTNTKLTRCACGAMHCDLMAHIADQN